MAAWPARKKQRHARRRVRVFQRPAFLSRNCNNHVARRRRRSDRARLATGAGRRRRVWRRRCWRRRGWRRPSRRGGTGRRARRPGRNPRPERPLRRWRERGLRPRQERRRAEPQHPAQRAQRPANRGGGGGEQRRHLRVAQQVVELPAIPHRLRHQRQQPAGMYRQRARLARPAGLGRASRGGPSRCDAPVLTTDDQPGDALIEVADAADDERDQRRGQLSPGAPGVHRQGEREQNGGEFLGRGGEWRGHGFC